MTVIVLLCRWWRFSSPREVAGLSTSFSPALLVGTGALLELAARKPRSIAFRAAAAAIGVAAIVFGEADDAPGLVLFGGLLIVGTVALAFGRAQRGS